MSVSARLWVEDMYVGTLSVEILLGDIRSLKQKRGIVRPIVAELQRRYSVTVAEVGHQNLHRRSRVGMAVVAADARHCVEVLDACERLVAGRPEIELLSARRQLHKEDDDS